jgi:hypothetical protein
MTLLNQLSQLLLLHQNINKLVLTKKKKNLSEKMLLPKEVSVNFIILLKMVLSPIGTIWRKYGIIVISMSSEFNLKTIQLCSLKLQETHSRTEKECAKFSLRISKYLISTYQSKLFYPFTHPEEPLV